MKSFQACGYSKSGKTTLIKELISRLSARGYRVASIKDIHNESFQMDAEGKNTFVHSQAGASPVVARGTKETDFLYSQNMSFHEIVSKVSGDWLVVEGFHEFPLPKIVCGKTPEEVDEFFDDRTFAIAGVLSQSHKTYRDMRVYDPLNEKDVTDLVQLIEEKIFPLLPYVDDDCCRRCGLTCTEMTAAILREEKSYEDCTLPADSVRLRIGGRDIPMVPFVRDALKGSVTGFVSHLKGFEPGQSIELNIE